MSISPRRIGRYELEEQLGQGGMGEVWKALDTQLQRHVALKLLHANLHSDPTFVTRFEQEARVIASLRHPNIIEIHDFASEQHGPNDTVAYMVMEYVRGQTLADYIRNTSRKQQFPSANDLVYLFTAVSLAIDYAHSNGTIHRDIKPANILLDQRPPVTRAMGKPIVADFGLAKLQSAPTHTIIGSILGTPNYIAPEQAQGKSGDYRCDLYSLGIILYEITTGVTPFRGESVLSILRQHMQDPPTPPALLNPMISPALSAVILKSIAKKPEDRYASASEMTIALAQALNVVAPTTLLQPTRSAIPPVGTGGEGIEHRAAALSPFQLSSPSWAGISNPSQPNMLTPPSTVQQTPQLSPLQPSGASPPLEAEATHHVADFPAADTHNPRRPWLIALSLVALLVIIGAGAGLFALLQPHSPLSPQTTPTVTATVVGQIQFTSSTGISSNGYDVLHINLHNVPAPPAGKVYYAWINGVGVEINLPRWQLTPKNGSIQENHLTYTGYSNLLRPNSFFLITLEDSAMGVPTIPDTDPAMHIYYAKLSSTATTFNVISCAGNTSSCTSV